MTNAEQAMRFGYLLSEIELHARSVLDGTVQDVPFTLGVMQVWLDEALHIAQRVSREALDQVVRERQLPPDGPWVGQDEP